MSSDSAASDVRGVGARRAPGGAQIVNEPGAWSMSQLLSANPLDAQEFYCAVPRWTHDAIGMGPSRARCAGCLATLGGNPGQPEPPDVVAVIVPVEPAAPARWSVDFWVGDADATAAKASSLGGWVLEGPRESRLPHRATQHPQGASFSVSQLVTPH